MRGVLTDSSDDEYESDEGDDMDMLYENIRQLGLATSQQTMGSGTSSQETTPIKDKKGMSLLLFPQFAADIASDPAGSVTQFPSPNGSPSVPGPELHGLRSVPYLILSCTGGTDASALFLSYIICLHPTLRRILPYLPLPKASQHEEYGKGASSNCQGVIYLPNDNFTVAATRVLHCAEKIRDPRRDGQWPSPNARNQRRSVHHEQAMFKTELERARNKIQGTILRGEDGLTVDIWKIALRTLVVGRIMLWRMENPLDFPRVVHRKAIDWPSQSSTSRRRASSSLSDGSLSPIESPVLHPSAAPSALSVVLDLNTVYDDPKLPGCLPVHIWTKIIAMATDPNMFLSDRQLKKVIEWGGSRCALEKERDFVGQTRYQQIWRVLDSMECLAYE